MNDRANASGKKGTEIAVNLVIALALIIIQLSIALSQRPIRKSDEHPVPAPTFTDEDQIRFVLSDLAHGVRNRQPIRIARAFAENIDLKERAKGKSGPLLAELFAIDSVSISFSGNTATADCKISNRGSQQGFKDKLTLTRSKGLWKISGASELIDLIADQLFAAPKAGNGKTEDIRNEGSLTQVQSSAVGQASNTSVSSFVMSGRSVIRRLVPYTSVWSINESVTQQNLNRRLFLNPRDGDVVIPTGSSDYIAVVADRSWDRIVYGSFNGSWVKSYGDNPGDYRFSLPYGLDIDGSGNIYCIDGIRRVVFKLSYNSSSNTIGFVQQFSISGLVNAVDIDIDPLAEGFWLADCDGNAITQISNGGQVLGRATRAVDISTGATYSISAPSKIISYRDYYKCVSFIDMGKRRVITVTGVSFQGDALSGYVTVCEFDPQTNVNLSSLGIDYGYGHGLWVTDENNGMIHTFDVANYFWGGYLASIRTTSDGQAQWTAPKAFASTVMSVIYTTTYSNRIDFLTLDDWTSNSGINAYLPGADFLNPFTEFFDLTSIDPSWWGTTVGATLPAACRLKVDLYRSDGSFITTKYDMTTPASRSGVAITANNVGNPVGLFRARMSVLPSYNDSYGSYAQSWLSTDVWFAMPLRASMSGPSYVMPKRDYTWNVSITSGSSNFSRQWYVDGNPMGTGSSMTRNSGMSSFNVTCVVTDNFNNSTQTLSLDVTNDADGGDADGGRVEAPKNPTDLSMFLSPKEFGIAQNYPNPFNPETEILFAVPENSEVLVKISDILGREIRKLAQGQFAVGTHALIWRGEDSNGEKVGSGIYLCRMSAKGESGAVFNKVFKMLILK